MEHDIAWDGVGPSLRAPLLVEHQRGAVEVAEDVIGIEPKGEAVVHQLLREARIPHEFTTVHLLIIVSHTPVVGDVCRQFKSPRHRDVGTQTQVAVPRIDRLKVASPAVGVVIGDTALGEGIQPGVELIVELQLIVHFPAAHLAPLVVHAFHRGEINAIVEVGEEVIDSVRELLGTDPAELYDRKDNGKFMLDLKSVLKRCLVRSGLSEDNIDIIPDCTMCLHDKYWSHRYTGGVRGSLASVIMKP